jgi:hypothetical protein
MYHNLLTGGTPRSMSQESDAHQKLTSSVGGIQEFALIGWPVIRLRFERKTSVGDREGNRKDGKEESIDSIVNIQSSQEVCL